jgi:hypothetical protein
MQKSSHFAWISAYFFVSLHYPRAVDAFHSRLLKQGFSRALNYFITDGKIIYHERRTILSRA